MGYAIFSEFPCVPDKYPDICELLALYKKLTAEYTELLQEITDTNKKLDDYMSQLNTLIPGWIDDATQDFRKELTAMAAELQKNITDQNNAMNDLMHEYQGKLDVQLQNQNNKFCKALKDMECWVLRSIQQNRIWVEAQNEALRKLHELDVARLDAEDANLQGQIDSIRDTANSIADVTNKQLAEFAIRIDDYNSLMRLWYYEHRWEDKKWLEEEIAKMKQYVDNIPISSHPVDNPIVGAMTTINAFIEDYWNLVACRHGYTAEEFGLEGWITCELFNASNISCVDWYTEGKHILDGGWREKRVFSPVTGEYVWLGTAIQQIFDYLNANGVTAKDYDDMAITAETYDGKDVTAKEYLRKENL